MKIIQGFLEKLSNNRKWLLGASSVLAAVLILIGVILRAMPQAEAMEPIVKDEVNKTVTYNLSAIAAQHAGTVGVIRTNIDIEDADYKYYIMGDSHEYTNLQFNINYKITSSTQVPIYLDNVKIKMTVDEPAFDFSTNTSTGDAVEFNGCYDIIVKGDCVLSSTVEEAEYPVIRVESLLTTLYELEWYKGVDINNINRYVIETTRGYDTNVRFSSYEFADGEDKFACTLTVENANNSYAAVIGTTAGTIELETVDVQVSEGEGDPMPDMNFNGVKLSDIFKGKQLKDGVQILKGANGATGNITIDGALELTVISNGYGACIGGGGSEIFDKAAKDGGNVTINDGTVYLDAKGTEKGEIPAIGGGLNKAGMLYGNAKQTVINGGSIYITDSSMQFGYEGAYPVNEKGEQLYLFETNFKDNLDENNKLVVSSKRYAEVHRADIAFYMYSSKTYVDVDLGYVSSVDNQSLNYKYDGFGHKIVDFEENLYFYLPATKLCSLGMAEESYLTDGVPEFSALAYGEVPNIDEGLYWVANGSAVDITLKGIPSYVEIENLFLKNTATNAYENYLNKLVYDPATGNYTVKVEVKANSELVIEYASNITIDYDYGFVAGDSHPVTNLSKTVYELGETIAIGQGYTYSTELLFVNWYSTITGQVVTSINPDNVESLIDDNGVVRLKAKWNVEVSYDVGDGKSEKIPVTEVTYGETTNITVSSVVPTKENYVFKGWEYDGTLYQGGDICTVTPTKNIIFKANYIRSNFMIYIDASDKKFNEDHVSVYIGKTGGTVSEANNLVAKYDDGTYKEVNIGGITYYYAVVEDYSNVSIILTPHPGHVMTGQSVNVKYGNGGGFSVNTGSGEGGNISVELTVNSDDIYVTTDAEFMLQGYEIKFYDGLNENGGSQLWPNDKFTYTIDNMDRTFGDVLGHKAGELGSIRNRFYEFDGWLDKLTGNVYKNSDKIPEDAGDMILIAQWKELDKYPINPIVIEKDTNVESKDVFAVPHYVLEDGTLEEAYSEKVTDEETGISEKVYYAKENDDIVFKFYYYDNKGDVIETGNGVELIDIELKYIDSTDTEVKGEIDDGLNWVDVPKAKKDTPIDAYITIFIQRYTITYWDTRDYKHNNPTSYTCFDEIVLENLTENIGWLLVSADLDDTNFDDVKTGKITKIERGTVGNLVLIADWGDVQDDKYRAEIDPLIENGVVEMVYPIGRKEFSPKETLVIKAVPNPGYKLKGNIIMYRDMDIVTLDTNLITTFELKRNTAMYGTTEVTGSDGIYLVDMPQRDIIITAVFEIEQYTITYKNVGDLENKNVTTFTVNDVIELIPLEKEGYEFVGWRDEYGNILTKIVNMSRDVVLEAVFEEVVEEETEETTEKKEEETTEKKEEVVPPTVPTDDDSDKKKEEETTTKEEETTVTNPSVDVKRPHIVGGGNIFTNEVYTGDSTNVKRLVFICVAAALALIILVLTKKKKDEDEEEENEDGSLGSGAGQQENGVM